MPITARIIVRGRAEAEAVVSRQPLNYLAAMQAPFIWRHLRGRISDPAHDLAGRKTAGRILVVPSCVGSTAGALLLVEMIACHTAPAGIIVESTDPLIAAGGIISDEWFGRGIPIADEPDEDVFEQITTGDRVLLDATGERAIIRRRP
ncbi:MAG: aconitase X swivel domain-containing protein [Armatimonadota bacterium]